MMINYQELVENLDINKIKQLLDSLNVPYKDVDTGLLMPTVCHNANADEASWKLYYYRDSHIFYCYTECGGQSIFKFLQHFYEARQIEYDWYNDILKVVMSCSAFDFSWNGISKYKSERSNYEERQSKELPIYPSGVLDVFIKHYPVEWMQDNITRKTMDKFNILYSISQNKIIIPHYDVNNNLIGIRGRALNEWEIENIGKYMPVQIEGKWYSHPLSLNLYGLNVNKENIKRSGIVFLAEGEKSVLQAENFAGPHCTVATCGSNLNIYQIKLLMKECQPTEIVMCYDQEEKKGKQDYLEKLYHMCEKYKKYCNFSFIYDRRGLLKLKESPFDAGENKFNQLLEERVKVR